MQVEVGAEVVDDLGEDTRPVDGVDGSEVVRSVERRVGEESLDNVLRTALASVGCGGVREWTTHLAIIESALDSEVVDVRVGDGRHLRLLDGRDPALGVQDKDGDVLLGLEPVDGRTGDTFARQLVRASRSMSEGRLTSPCLPR